MTGICSELEPKKVFRFFEEISRIPRGSGNEKAVSDYLVSFARSKGLEVIQDAALNVIIKKPGTPGYENAPAVIVQGHMDMVCDKNKATIHDFEKDPIKLKIEGDMLYADGTTLGADDGIAAAYGLALLDSDEYPHPPLEILMTVEEEVGLCGAAALDPDNLKGRLLINLDSEDEGMILSGCAGGSRTTHFLPAAWEDCPEGTVSYRIGISGLKGGHSGGDIHEYRGNSNKLMGRLLDDILNSINVSISDINGGQKSNAIPREADAVVAVKPGEEKGLFGIAEKWDGIFKNELRASDPGVSVAVEKLGSEVKRVFSHETAVKAVKSLLLIPDGVRTMSMEIKGLAESSSNLGIVSTGDDGITFESAVRSSVRSLKYYILKQSRVIAELLGAEFTMSSDYPEWQYNPGSPLLSLASRIYREKFGKESETIAVHGGVECGIFKEKLPGIDMISIGPDMYDVHTPDEHLSISSTARTWEYILEILKQIK
jgi:dipeptidase D